MKFDEKTNKIDQKDLYQAEDITSPKNSAEALPCDTDIAIPEDITNKNIFDKMADLFKKMTLGIFTFTWKLFKLLGCNFVKSVKKIVKYLHSMIRLIFWATIWMFITLLGFIAFAWTKFVNFWEWIWSKITYFAEIFVLQLSKYIWPFFQEYCGEIWLSIAIIGSIYGLIYVTLKRRAKKKGKKVKGFLFFLRRKEAKEENIQEK